MQGFIDALKVNLLSIVALPLLISALFFQMLNKILEKAILLLGVGAMILLLSIVNQIVNNPKGFFEGMGTFMVMMIISGSILGLALTLVFFLGGVIAAVITAALSLVLRLTNYIFSVSKEGYIKLFDLCEEHIESASNSQNKVFYGFWYVLKAFRGATLLFFSAALPIAISTGIGGIVYSLFFIHRALVQNFGVGIFTYLSWFPIVNAVFAVVYFLVVAIGAVLILLSLGNEWSELSDELKGD